MRSRGCSSHSVAMPARAREQPTGASGAAPPPGGGALGRVLVFLRFSHTVFALPFALGAMFVAAGGWPGWRVFALVLVAMVSARSAAMAFNRVADWELDKRNPRTAYRHRLLSRRAGILIVLASSLVFIAAAWLLNPLCFALSPLALFCALFYSLTKRFTSLAHFFLGLALAVSPVGGWLAVSGQFAPPPLVLALAVLLWVAGFDIIYALQDREFDRRSGLHSLAARLAPERALLLARLLHLLALGGLIGFGVAAGLGLPYHAGMVAIAIVLGLEHATVDADSAAAIQKAFFRDNALVGLLFLVACLLASLPPL